MLKGSGKEAGKFLYREIRPQVVILPICRHFKLHRQHLFQIRLVFFTGIFTLSGLFVFCFVFLLYYCITCFMRKLQWYKVDIGWKRHCKHLFELKFNIFLCHDKKSIDFFCFTFCILSGHNVTKSRCILILSSNKSFKGWCWDISFLDYSKGRH